MISRKVSIASAQNTYSVEYSYEETIEIIAYTQQNFDFSFAVESNDNLRLVKSK